MVQFIGQVNLFRGRVHRGWAHVGDAVRIALPEHEQTANANAVAYVRPHELEVHLQPNETGGYLVADVENVTIAGAVLRLDLQQDGSDEPIRVELPRGNPEHEKLKAGDRVYLRPIKHRVFIDDNATPASESTGVASEDAHGPA